MLNGNPNNFNWRTRLEDVNNLPGEILADKNATWEKLQNRLHAEPGRTRLAWYWAAAVCLLPAIVISLLNINKRQHAIVENSAPRVQSKNVIVPPVSFIKESMPANIFSGSVEKMEAITKPGHANNKNASPNNKLSSEIAVIDKIANQKEIQPTQIVSPLPVFNEPVLITVAALATKKKLKVVHINELGDLEETPNRMLITDDHLSAVKFINQDIFASSSLRVNNAGFNIFKTKSIPSN